MLSFFKRALRITEDKSPVEGIVQAQEIMDSYNENVDENLKNTIYDLIRSIRDPEKPSSLEDLSVVYEGGVIVRHDLCSSQLTNVLVEFNPTVPHCSLATLIGLCIRIKLQRCLPQQIKLDIVIKKGAHDTEDEINKQVNDKERIAAAMENPNLKEIVEKCIREDE